MIKNFTLKIDYLSMHIDPEFKPAHKNIKRNSLKHLPFPEIQELAPSEWVCAKIIGYAKALKMLNTRYTGVIETVMN